MGRPLEQSICKNGQLFNLKKFIGMWNQIRFQYRLGLFKENLETPPTSYPTDSLTWTSAQKSSTWMIKVNWSQKVNTTYENYKDSRKVSKIVVGLYHEHVTANLML